MQPQGLVQVQQEGVDQLQEGETQAEEADTLEEGEGGGGRDA